MFVKMLLRYLDDKSSVETDILHVPLNGMYRLTEMFRYDTWQDGIGDDGKWADNIRSAFRTAFTEAYGRCDLSEIDRLQRALREIEIEPHGDYAVGEHQKLRLFLTTLKTALEKKPTMVDATADVVADLTDFKQDLDLANEQIAKLTAALHANECHPDYYYETTRHAMMGAPIDLTLKGWELNVDKVPKKPDNPIVAHVWQSVILGGPREQGIVTLHWRKTWRRMPTKK
jgi:hypothetical protein